jgi:RND superfamily putative drug exporter
MRQNTPHKKNAADSPQVSMPVTEFTISQAQSRQVAGQAAALASLPKYASGIRSPLSAGARSLVSSDGRSALVTFDVPGNVASVDQAAAADRRAVAAVQASHPDLVIAESGSASITRAVDSSLNFSKAEATSVPITLILLVAVFGALTAAGISGASRGDRAHRGHWRADDRQPLAAGRQLHL